MKNPQSIDLSVIMKEITLSPSNLDNLASEFYGFVAPYNKDEPTDIISVIFNDIIDKENGTKIKASDCLEQFTSALDSFRVAKIQKTNE
jgi:hypothetical protein